MNRIKESISREHALIPPRSNVTLNMTRQRSNPIRLINNPYKRQHLDENGNSMMLPLDNTTQKRDHTGRD